LRILVIGGSGFIGPFVIERLSRDEHQVAVFHRGNSRVELPASVQRISGDRNRLAEYRRSFERFAPEIVVDMILSSGSQARELMETFEGITRRVVALSSMDVYRACGVLHGLEPGPVEAVPLKEDSPLRTKLQTYPPQQIRMLQKVFGWLNEDYDKIPVEREVLGHSNLPATVLRLSMVYGPRDPLNRLLPIVKRIHDGRKAILFSAGMAQWRGPRGYVDNVAAAIASAATSERAAGGVYNVAEPDAFTELEWARKVASVAGWNGEFVVVSDERAPAHLRPPPGNPAQHWAADTTRIRRCLGYREPIGYEEAIRRTIKWMRENPATNTGAHAFDYAAEDAAIAEMNRITRAPSAT
jgi:nucleoside-diphosphate-sugar epimerase